MRTFIATYHPHYKELIYIGIPIVIGQIGIVLVGLADNIMVGRYDTLHLAAASFVNSAFNIPILFGLGFSYGLTPLVGQCFGRKDKFRIGQLLKHSLIANGLTGVLLTLVMTVLYFNIDRLGQPQELLPLIRPYYLLQLASLVFVMLFNAFKQFADGITDTRTPMYIMISANVLNIIGNYILIYGKLGIPPLGVTGAGISTLASRILMLAAFIVIFCRSRHYRRYFTGYKRSQSNRKDFFTLNRMGWMIGVQMGLETALFSITGIMIGWLGSIALASHQCIFFFSKDIIGWLFTDSPEVIEMVSTLVLILIAYQFGDSLQITYANSLRGIGDVTSMAVISFIGYIVIALPVCYLCGFVFDWGIQGVWAGYPVGLTLTGILLCLRYYRDLRCKTHSLTTTNA